MPGYHARWSPSAAHRLLNCPASMQLGEQFPDSESEYAKAGTLAHSIAELKARRAFLGLATRTYNSKLKKLQSDELYDASMDGYTTRYVEQLEAQAMTFSTAPFIALETSVPIGAFTGERKPDGSWASGTADCVQIGDDTLWITDYKNGAGVPVDVNDNPQLMLYALGALVCYAPVYGDSIRFVRMTIVQPAISNIASTEPMSIKELDHWATFELIPKAVKAFADDPGEPTPGDWCRFCRARHTCRARTAAALECGRKWQRDPRLLTDAEVGEALASGETLTAWYSDLKDYALRACLDGRTIDGYKAVNGRSSRAWTPEAFDILPTRGVEEALLYERKPVTVAGLEKSLGKKTFGELTADLVVTNPGAPTLVPDKDKRPAITSAALAFKPIEK